MNRDTTNELSDLDLELVATGKDALGSLGGLASAFGTPGLGSSASSLSLAASGNNARDNIASMSRSFSRNTARMTDSFMRNVGGR